MLVASPIQHENVKLRWDIFYNDDGSIDLLEDPAYEDAAWFQYPL